MERSNTNWEKQRNMLLWFKVNRFRAKQKKNNNNKNERKPLNKHFSNSIFAHVPAIYRGMRNEQGMGNILSINYHETIY